MVEADRLEKSRARNRLIIPRRGRISMMTYLKKVLTDFPEEIKGRTTIPNTDHPFKVRSDDTR